MVLGELLGPADLSGAQTLCIHKQTEVIMVHKDKNLMLTAFQIVTPCLEGFDNGQKLTVVGLVSCFRWNHFPQKEGFWMLLAQNGFSDYSIRTSSESWLA